MRKHAVRSVLSLMLLFGVVAIASAQGIPGNAWYTSVTIQNVGVGDASVTLQAFPQGTGAAVSSNPVTIPKNKNKVFLPGTTGANFIPMNLPSGFSGSMVVSASDNVVAIAQLGNNVVGSNGTPGGLAAGQYRGSSVGDSKITYPSVKNSFGNKLTIFSVQATGDVGYTATIKDNAGGTHTKTGTIGANRSVFLRPDTGFTPAMAGTNCGTQPNTSPCLGSLSVQVTSGTGQLVGAEVETQTNVSPQTVAQATSMFTTADASNTAFCTAIKYGFDARQNRHSGVAVQNVGTAAVKVRLTVKTDSTLGANPNQTYTQDIDIPVGASRTFIGTTNTLGGMPPNNLGAGTLTTINANGTLNTNGRIIAAVNEANFAGPAALKATTYACSSAGSATRNIAFPLVKENFSGSSGAVNVQNVGSNPTVVTLTYTCSARNGTALPTKTLTTASLPTGKSQVFFLRSEIVDDSLCAVTAQAAAQADKIIGISQESSDYSGGTLDTKNFEGFNLP
jgi:hypothetical protein